MRFPLRLTAFEEYMFVDDRPSHPMGCFVNIWLDGHLDRQRFQSAVQSTLTRHPLFRCTVAAAEPVASTQTGPRKVPRGPLKWHWHEDPQVPIQWQTTSSLESALDEVAFPRILLNQEIGIRLVIRESPTKSKLTIQFHHSCCDGMGIVSFLEDLIRKYSEIQPSPGVGIAQLAHRRTYGVSLLKRLKVWTQQSVAIAGIRQFMGRHPQPLTLAPGESPSELPAGYPTISTTELTPEQSRDLRVNARNEGVRLNDLLVRDFFLAIEAWRKLQGMAAADQWTRLMIPMNLRQDPRQATAMNLVSAVFLDRQPADCQDRSQLLRGVHQEMELIKRYQLQFTFIACLRLVRRLPGGIASSTRPDRCYASCVFTNLGDPFSALELPRKDGKLLFGGLVLEQIQFLPPLRPHTCAALSVVTYDGRLTFALHYDPRRLESPAAHELMQCLTRQLLETAESNSPTTAP